MTKVPTHSATQQRHRGEDCHCRDHQGHHWGTILVLEARVVVVGCRGVVVVIVRVVVAVVDVVVGEATATGDADESLGWLVWNVCESSLLLQPSLGGGGVVVVVVVVGRRDRVLVCGWAMFANEEVEESGRL